MPLTVVDGARLAVHVTARAVGPVLAPLSWLGLRFKVRVRLRVRVRVWARARVRLRVRVGARVSGRVSGRGRVRVRVRVLAPLALVGVAAAAHLRASVLAVAVVHPITPLALVGIAASVPVRASTWSGFRIRVRVWG